MPVALKNTWNGKQSDEEELARRDFFKAKARLKKVFSKKYSKYVLTTVKLKDHVKHKGSRIGKYKGFELPIFYGDACNHRVEFKSGIFHLQESMFEIHKDMFGKKPAKK